MSEAAQNLPPQSAEGKPTFAPKLQWRAGGYFVFASLFAGLLNYVFQVIASRRLDALAFGRWNDWYANLAIFFLIGGWIQYMANFRPASGLRLKSLLIGLNLLLLGTLVFWFPGTSRLSILQAALVVGAAAVFGWLSGQLQARLSFKTLASANVLVGTVKLILIFWPLIGLVGVPIYGWAVFAGYLPAVWWVSACLWRNPQAPPVLPQAVRDWAGPLLLSIAGAVFPQWDLVLMSHTQSADIFAQFARASLFYKALYFAVAILAQWLLPYQIQGHRWGWKHRRWQIPLLLVGLAGALTAVAPFISHWILGWSEAPPASLIFLSCLNMGLLTVLFMELQQACAQHQIRRAAGLLSAIFLEGVLQWGVQASMIVYLIGAVVVQSCLILKITATARTSR